MIYKKNDFIEIEFTAKTSDDGKIFDSNKKENLEKINPEIKPEKAKPLIMALGQNMFLNGVENYILNNNIKEKEELKIELPAEKAFGKRQTELIQRFPLKIFRENQINPLQGYLFNFDGRIGKVLTASGGRVIVDFNNPIAGRDVIYEIKILRKVENLNEKVKALNDFFFGKELNFEIDEKNKKIIFDVEEKLRKFLELFSEKYRDILNMNFEFKKEDKKSEEKEKNIEKKEDNKNKKEN